jgi:transposase
MKQMKYTIRDLQADFPDEAACLVWLKDFLYPDGIFCESEKCKQIRPHHLMKTRRSFSCEYCGHHVHPTAGTIFHKSTTPLTLWFYAIYLMTATRAGISAKQLERELGVTYKTAWRMFHQIRQMMSSDDKALSGEVEVDEMYISPDTSKRTTAKANNCKVVFGMVERGGRAKVKHVKNAKTPVLLPLIWGNVDSKSTIYSDEHRSYKKLPEQGYKHKTIKHSYREYVNGEIHTQNVENLWSNMKRGIKGVYRHVGDNYLQAYIDEYAFRYSYRKSPVMFWVLMTKVVKPI